MREFNFNEDTLEQASLEIIESLGYELYTWERIISK